MEKLHRDYFIRWLAAVLFVAQMVTVGSKAVSGAKPHKRLPSKAGWLLEKQGAVIRMDTTRKIIFFISSADEFGEGAGIMLDILKEKGASASFFLTGNFLRNPQFREVVRRMKQEGHYVGPHSDRHLLYNSWENRDSLLVSKNEFRKDVLDNLAELRKAGIKKKHCCYFLPPYEWYNRQICEWSSSMGLQIINFTPGTGTNADYTTPGMASYKTSDELTDRLFRFDENNRLGLKGSIILIHLGTHPDRKDKFYNRLGSLIDELRGRGYTFGRF